MPVSDRQTLLQILGSQDENRRLMERELDIRLALRDNALVVTGRLDTVQRAAGLLAQLVAVAEQGKSVSAADVTYLVRMMKAGEDVENVQGLLTDTVIVSERGKPIGPRTVGQKRYVEAIRRCDLVLGIGPAGTGKTFLAVAMAVAALKAKKVARIILTRPAVEAGERLGFLPGDLQEKVDPYLRPLYDALYEMLDMEKAQKYLERRIIEVAPLAYMRGRTLNDAFIILDEAQNTTTAQMKMFLTRMGFGSKIVVTGDVTQIDLPSGRASGLNAVREILAGVPGIEFIYLTDSDVVRHKLVQRIIQAYELYESKQKAQGDSEASALNHTGQEEEQPDVQPTQEDFHQSSIPSPASEVIPDARPVS